MVAGIRPMVALGLPLHVRSLRHALETMPPMNTGGVVGGGGIDPCGSPNTAASEAFAASLFRIHNGQLIEVAANLRRRFLTRA